MDYVVGSVVRILKSGSHDCATGKCYNIISVNIFCAQPVEVDSKYGYLFPEEFEVVSVPNTECTTCKQRVLTKKLRKAEKRVAKLKKELQDVQVQA